ncbi:PRP1 splicing factor [Apiospora hydei]|uniref:PRP1 splicing factor n=1 Tax=Apiospora hydei TaxID=1337664 RepID=A0ABR1WRI9_9PEZI
MANRQSFLDMPAPENYVAGLGRGATGFTTRSDLGPAREGPSEDQIKEALAKRAAQLGFGDAVKKDDDKDDNANDERFQDPDSEVGLFAGGIYDKDDDEADRIYKEVDEKMARRGKKRREAREQAEKEEFERNNPKIQQQFSDLKRALGNVTDDEWASLPEVGDLTGKARRAREARRNQRSYAVPDSVIAAASGAGELGSIVVDGPESSGASAEGTMTNFAKIGEARDKVLQVRLDQASQSSGTASTVGSASSIDPKGYLTSLAKSQLPESAAQVGDINRVRELLNSVIKTNPNNGPGWIAAARLEEMAGKIVQARNLMAKGCQQCPKNEDVWLENIRLNEGRNAKIIASDAIKLNNSSVRLWVEAMKLETDPRSKKIVIRKALDHIPESEALWKEAVNLEEDPKLIPRSLDLWLALAHLETPENAQKVLNKARKHLPTSHEIWIAAARLQEQLGTATKLNVPKRAVQVLAKEGAMPKREVWIEEAEKCEAEGAIVTCGLIVQETLGWNLDEDDDRKDTWMEDARSSINRGMYITARAIYAYALRVFPTSKTIWLAAADLERNHGTKGELWAVLEKAVNACPRSEILWMMLAKEKWMAGEIDNARRVLGRAFKQNPNNEDIWLAAVKLEAENNQIQQARMLLQQARQEAPTDRVWMKSAAFERTLGDNDAALDLVSQALDQFPAFPKLWMIKGQIYEDIGKPLQAREAYGTGVKACPSSASSPKARSVLDRARLAVPKNPELWCESVRIERRAGNTKQAEALMERALRDVPKPAQGALWSEKIWHLTQRPQRKARGLEAIKEVDNDPTLLVAVARIFWGERKLDKAQNWFEKALVRDADLGDSWAWYYKFLLEHGTSEKRDEVVGKCVSVEPRHGEVWQRIAKTPANSRKGVEETLKMVAAELR